MCEIVWKYFLHNFYILFTYIDPSFILKIFSQTISHILFTHKTPPLLQKQMQIKDYSTTMTLALSFNHTSTPYKELLISFQLPTSYLPSIYFRLPFIDGIRMPLLILPKLNTHRLIEKYLFPLLFLYSLPKIYNINGNNTVMCRFNYK